MSERPGVGRKSERGQPMWWSRRTVGAAVLALVVLIGMTVATRAWFHTRDATRRTVAALDATHADLARADDELGTAVVGFAAARVTLGGALWTLETRRDERDAAQQSFDETDSLLTDLQAQLAAATVDLAAGTARQDALDRCLVGVAEALNQVSVGDVGGVAATIRGIEGTCAQAGVGL